MNDWLSGYLAKRKALVAATHDEGADEALREVLLMSDALSVDCMAYCYGGSARLDRDELLADLAEAGWKLCRVAP